MILIEGEHLNVESKLFNHVKIQGYILAGVLAGLYEENDCEDFEEFSDCLKDENILIYIKKEGV